MDTEKAFKNIQENIKNENFSAVRPEIDSIIEANPGDALLMLKCASLLKTIDDENGCQSLVTKAMENVPADGSLDYDTALAVRGLGRPADAFRLIKRFRDDPERMNEVARTMLMIDEPEEALAVIRSKKDLDAKDRLLLCDILCALGEFSQALDEAESLLKDEGDSYAVLVNLYSVMMRMGKDKEAIKHAKSHLKEDKKNADALAVQAYVMWVSGKTPAAANYANRALQIQFTHLGALEIMAMCFVEKGKYHQAKFFAGVINDTDPGNPAVIRILDACRISSNA